MNNIDDIINEVNFNSNKILIKKIDNLEKKIDDLNIALNNFSKNNNIINDVLSIKNINEQNKIENYEINKEYKIKEELKIDDYKIKTDKYKKNENNTEFKYKEIIEETYNIDDIFIKSCLDNGNILNDIKIFKKIYIDKIPKEYYPIRHMKKKLQYWNNNHMNDDDINGTYIKNTILKNIEKCYLKVNIYDNYSNNMEQFLKNQDYINTLRDEKYKDKFLSKIISIINI